MEQVKDLKVGEIYSYEELKTVLNNDNSIQEVSDVGVENFIGCHFILAMSYDENKNASFMLWNIKQDCGDIYKCVYNSFS